MFYHFHAPTTTTRYPLSLHDALPILRAPCDFSGGKKRFERSRGQTHFYFQWTRRISKGANGRGLIHFVEAAKSVVALDRKSTRLNSSHRCISYAVFCLKKKKEKIERE